MQPTGERPIREAARNDAWTFLNREVLKLREPDPDTPPYGETVVQSVSKRINALHERAESLDPIWVY